MDKVLLVEDDEVTASCFIKILAEHDVSVDYFNNVGDLRKNYKNLEDYNIIFVDLFLQNGDWGRNSGKDLLREMIKVTDMPFYVVWTGYGYCKDAEECLSIGASLVVKKNGDKERLTKLVNHINKSYELTNELNIRYG